LNCVNAIDLSKVGWKGAWGFAQMCSCFVAVCFF